jgi:hypothetical protein
MTLMTMFIHLKNLLLICIVALLFAGCAKKDNGKIKLTIRLNKAEGARCRSGELQYAQSGHIVFWEIDIG